jgi:hypothetical protein
MKCNGKIGRLPAPILEELHTRLHKGETQIRLAAWLNSLPEVQAVLAGHFQGRPIKQQNIVEWKQRHHPAWLRKHFPSESQPAPKKLSDPTLEDFCLICPSLALEVLNLCLRWYRHGLSNAPLPNATSKN